MNTFPSTTSEGLAANKPSIPPPYKYKSEFDTLRSMGFPSRQIVSVLDSSEGNIDVAVAMLLSQSAQEVPDIPEVVQTTTTTTTTTPPSPPPPPPALQRMFAAAAAVQPASDSHEYTQLETKISGKKPRNVYADIIELLMDYPDGIDGCQLKPYFDKKYDRKLLIPEGESLSSWLKSIRGVSATPWQEGGGRTVYYYEGSGSVEGGGTTSKKQNITTTKGTQSSAGSGGFHHEERPNDWTCSSCDSVNFEWRTSCHACQKKVAFVS